FVNQVLQPFLPPAAIGRDLSFLQHVCFQFGEAGCPGIDLLTNARIVAAVTLLDELSQTSILADGGSNLGSAGEGIHPADMSMEQIHRIETLTANFGIEVCSAGVQTTLFKNHEHHLRGEI